MRLVRFLLWHGSAPKGMASVISWMGEAQRTSLTTFMAGGPEINFFGPKDYPWKRALTGTFEQEKCCISTFRVFYAIELSCSERSCSVVNVWACFVLHWEPYSSKVLQHSVPITLPRDMSQLMQVVKYTAWIILGPTGLGDSDKASISLLFVSKLFTFGRAPSGAWTKCSNLVDPASSHMLVSKIKPCMSKYK